MGAERWKRKIAANKLVALFGRADIKDFVDVYLLLHSGYELDELFKMAKEKDPGLEWFFLAGMFRQITRHKKLPRMIKPVDLNELRSFFEKLAKDIIRRLEPNNFPYS